MENEKDTHVVSYNNKTLFYISFGVGPQLVMDCVFWSYETDDDQRHLRRKETTGVYLICKNSENGRISRLGIRVWLTP